MLRNQKDAVRGGKMVKVRREEKEDLIARFLLGIGISALSVHPGYPLLGQVGGEPREHTRTKQNAANLYLVTVMRDSKGSPRTD